LALVGCFDRRESYQYSYWESGLVMFGWFQALMPKEERFFELFADHSHAVLAGAQALRAMLEGGPAIEHNFKIVMDREHDADNVTREVLIAVRRTFITPFDRSNIRDLITSMDNAIDQMQKTAKGIELFEQKQFTAEMREMADTIVRCAELVQQAVPLLKQIGNHAGTEEHLVGEDSLGGRSGIPAHDELVRNINEAEGRGEPE